MAKLPDNFSTNEFALPSLDGLRDHLQVGRNRAAVKAVQKHFQ